jgi:hypothetical protein
MRNSYFTFITDTGLSFTLASKEVVELLHEVPELSSTARVTLYTPLFE